jgi:hypothetical protein
MSVQTYPIKFYANGELQITKKLRPDQITAITKMLEML